MAAAELHVDVSTVRRWISGKANVTGTREGAVQDFITSHPTEVGSRPLHRYSDDDLLAELQHRLGIVDRSSDPRRTKRSSNVSVSPPAAARGSKSGRSRLDGVRGDAKGDTGNAEGKGESRP